MKDIEHRFAGVAKGSAGKSYARQQAAGIVME